MSNDIHDLAKRIVNIKSSNSPRLLHRTILDGNPELFRSREGLVQVVDFDGKSWNFGARTAFRRNANLGIHGLRRFVSRNPTQIHGDLQSQKLSIESLGQRDISRRNIRNDS